MSKTRKLRPADRHITRAECQALIVHTLNEVFGQIANNTGQAGGVHVTGSTQTVISGNLLVGQ